MKLGLHPPSPPPVASNRTIGNAGSGTCPRSSLGFNTDNQIVTPSGYQYDAAGNMTNDTVHTYTYDAEGRLLTVDGSSGAYVYDAFGRRIEKTTASGSLVYLYDISGHEITEVDTSGNNVEEDIWVGSRQLAMYYGNSTYFFNSDQVGTERVATDPTGAAVQTCINMPYGDDFSCTGSLPEGRFAGYARDSESGLAYAPARYYSPALGRFMTPDPLSDGAAGGLSASIPSLGEGYSAAPLSPMASKLRNNAVSGPQGWDAFAYVTDSPATRIDPSGLCGQPCDPTLDPNCLCDPTTDPFCGCDPTFGPDCGGGCGADRPCRCNPAIDPTCGGGGLFLRGGGGGASFARCTCVNTSLDPQLQFFGCGPYLCQCEDGEVELTGVPPRHKLGCLFKFCPEVIVAIKPWGAEFSWGSLLWSFPHLCN